MSILLFILAVLAACAVSPLFMQAEQEVVTEEGLPDGGWKGVIATESRWSAGGMPMPDKSTLYVGACKGKMWFYFEEADGRISAAETMPIVSSQLGTHSIAYQFRDLGDLPAWVELRRVEVVEIDETTAHAQFSRSFSNLTLGATEAKRTLFATGTAVLTRYNKQCPATKIR